MKTKKEKKVAVEAAVPEEKNETVEVAKPEVKETPKVVAEKLTEAKKEKITVNKKEKVESRPGMLRRKVAELGKKATIEKLLKDTELMEKYLLHQNWIRNDYARLQEKTAK